MVLFSHPQPGLTGDRQVSTQHSGPGQAQVGWSLKPRGRAPGATVSSSGWSCLLGRERSLRETRMERRRKERVGEGKRGEKRGGEEKRGEKRREDKGRGDERRGKGKRGGEERRGEERIGEAPRLTWGKLPCSSVFVSPGFLALSHLFSFLLRSASVLVLFPFPSVSITLFLYFSLLFLFPSLCLSAGHPNPAPDSLLQSTIPILHSTDFGVTEGGHIQALETPI